MDTLSKQKQELLNPTYAYGTAFIEELERAGIRDVVICPGSRSTPLALIFAAQANLHCWTLVDERSAAFFGLGLAKRSATPVVLLCTSGTAAANFLPALIEARLSRIPLLVLTADRPHELRECGAPQSIDQIRLFGTHVKWFVDLALPEATEAMLRYIRVMANRAVSLAQAIPAGPVHLNFPLREPLTPEAIADYPLPAPEQRQQVAWRGRPNDRPYVAVSNAPLAAPTSSLLTSLAHDLRAATRGLIIVGPQNDPDLADSLLPLARALHYPILADPLSQVRGSDSDMLISSYDAFLRVRHDLQKPEYILRFGAMPTSKPLLLYLKQHSDCPQLVIDGQNGWEEPTQLASALIHSDQVAFCQSMLTALQTFSSSRRQRNDERWLLTWQKTEQLTRHALTDAIQQFGELFEGRVFTELVNLLPAKATLCVGNSMPIRDLDTFFWCQHGRVRLLGNRGANGIDGQVSTALGISAAAGPEEPTFLVIGDLSLYHDLNGLLAAHLYPLHLTIILINNDGGGIFSFLPQAAYPTHFEQLFGTPLGLNYQHAGDLYGCQVRRVQTWQQFHGSVQDALQGEGVHIIELNTERQSNVRMHRQLWQAVEQALLEARVASL